MKFISKFSIKSRLFASLILSSLMIIAVGAMGINGLRMSNQSIDDMYSGGMQHTLRTAGILDNLGESRAELLLALQHDPSTPLAVMHNHSVSKHIDHIIEATAEADRLLNEIHESDLTTGEADLVTQIHMALNTITKQGFTPAIQALQAQDFTGANKILIESVNPAFLKTDHAAEGLLSYQQKEAEEAFISAEERYSQIVTWSFVLLMVGMLLSAILTLMTNKSITLAVKNLDEAATQLADGQLTMRADENGHDELSLIAKSFNRVGEKFQGTVTEIMNAVDQLASTAEETSIVTNQSTQSIQQQRTETEMVATAMNQMNATVHEVAQSASQASDIAKEAKQASELGEDVVSKTMNAINALANEVEQASGVIQNVENESENIGKVLDVIRGIAEQTNLLALNAAIEAARAGEQGRGFAVVADEVRTLASRTQQSTEEIQQMISQLQAGAQSAVEAMAAGQAKAQSGVTQAQEAGGALNRISVAVDEINGMNAQIATAVEEQSVVTDEINKNISNINQIAVQTSTGAEQTAQASADLARLAEHLKATVSHFKIA